MFLVGICALVSLIGLIFVVLQKKEVVKPVFRSTTAGFRVVSGGTITAMGTVIGSILLYNRGATAAALIYIGVIVLAYLLIQVVFRRRTEKDQGNHS